MGYEVQALVLTRQMQYDAGEKSLLGTLYGAHFSKILVKGYQLKMKVVASKERVHIYEIKNPGVKITEDLRWNMNISNICTLAKRIGHWLDMDNLPPPPRGEFCRPYFS